MTSFWNREYKCSGCDIGFDPCPEFSFAVGALGENVIIFGADMSLSVHTDNKN